MSTKYDHLDKSSPYWPFPKPPWSLRQSRLDDPFRPHPARRQSDAKKDPLVARNDNEGPPPYQYDYAHHYPPCFSFSQIIGLILCAAMAFAGLLVAIVELHK